MAEKRNGCLSVGPLARVAVGRADADAAGAAQLTMLLAAGGRGVDSPRWPSKPPPPPRVLPEARPPTVAGGQNMGRPGAARQGSQPPGGGFRALGALLQRGSRLHELPRNHLVKCSGAGQGLARWLSGGAGARVVAVDDGLHARPQKRSTTAGRVGRGNRAAPSWPEGRGMTLQPVRNEEERRHDQVIWGGRESPWRP